MDPQFEASKPILPGWSLTGSPPFEVGSLYSSTLAPGRAGQEQPQRDIDDDPEPEEQREEDEHHAQEYRVDVEPFSETSAHAGDLPVRPRQVQARRRPRLAGARLLGSHHPQQQIDQRPEAAEKQREEKEQPEEHGIDIEVFAEPSADPGEFLVVGQSMELLHASCSGIRMGRSYPDDAR